MRLTEQPDYLKNHKADKTFYKDYRKKLHANLGMDDSFSSECSEKSPKKIHQVRLIKVTGTGSSIDISRQSQESHNFLEKRNVIC